MSDENFEWPCSRREAHGPHQRECVGWIDPDPNAELNAPAYATGGGKVTPDPECPGVRAHPNTMIGRAHHA